MVIALLLPAEVMTQRPSAPGRPRGARRASRSLFVTF